MNFNWWGISLVVQWIRLPVQGLWIQSMVGEHAAQYCKKKKLKVLSSELNPLRNSFLHFCTLLLSVFLYWLKICWLWNIPATWGTKCLCYSYRFSVIMYYFSLWLVLFWFCFFKVLLCSFIVKNWCLLWCVHQNWLQFNCA